MSMHMNMERRVGLEWTLRWREGKKKREVLVR
jgi:hypothetical protein